MKTDQTSSAPPHPNHPLMVIAAAVFLGGCSFLRPHDDPTRFFVLTVPRAVAGRFPGPGTERLKVGLKPVEVPAYLRCKSMVVRLGTNEIHFAEFDRWAEPLGEGIGRVMKESLGSAGNIQAVALNSRGEATLDWEVAIRVTACEGVQAAAGAGSVRFAATWEIRGGGTGATATKLGGFTTNAVPWDGRDCGQLALRLSEAIAAAGTALAADLPKEARPSPGAEPPSGQ